MGEVVKYPDAPHTEGSDLRAVVEALNRLEDSMGQRHTENTSSMRVLEKELRIVIDRVDDLARGFPDNDPEGHRRAHEAQIRRAEAQAKFFEDLRADLAKKGLWAVLGVLAFALWQFVKARLNS